jgi:hypothetical protein
VLNGLEQVNERLVTCGNVLDGLLRVEMSSGYSAARELRQSLTPSRMAKPANTAFAGGNDCEIRVRN